MAIQTFDEAIDQSKDADRRSVLLGNGFSMAFSGNFGYSRLRDVASMTGLAVDKDALFDEARSDDFETVIEHLRRAARLVKLYEPGNDSLVDAVRDDAKKVKRGLVDALVSVHPDSAWQVEDDRYARTRKFLSEFKDVFTLSYDLLLYWTVVQSGPARVPMRDGFGRDDGVLTWHPTNGQHVHYLHGAVHYFVKERRLRKLEVGDGNLLDQLSENLATGQYPLVVTEGSREDKAARIARSVYLTHCHEQFRALSGTLFVHGMAMSENDGHVLDILSEPESAIDTIYVGLFGQNSASRRLVKARAEALAEQRKENGGEALRVHFYKAQSAPLW